MFFNQIALYYENYVYGISVPPQIQEFLTDEYNFVFNEINNLNDVRLIDFGCGSGYYLKKFNKYIHYGVGVDISIEMINLAKTKLRGLPQMNLIQEDVCQIDTRVEKGEYNLGICTYNTLGTVKNWQLFLRQMITLMNGGVLLISLFAGEKFSKLAEKIYNEWDEYVGPAENNLFDKKNRIFQNDKTGFISHWFTLNELSPFLINFPVKREIIGMGHFIRIECKRTV